VAPRAPGWGAGPRICDNRPVNTIEAYRESFEEEPGYLDFAAFGPLSPTVREEAHADLEALATGRPSGLEHVGQHVGNAQAALAQLLGSKAEQVTLQPSTTEGIMHALFGLRGAALVSPGEFATMPVATQRAADALGVLTPQWLDTPDGRVTPKAVRNALTDDTTALVVSLVDFRTGYRADLSALREVIGDRLLIVDAIQGFGIVDADYAAADVVAGNGYKWLRAGRGTGFAWFSERALDRLTPVFSGITGTDMLLPIDGVPQPSRAANAFTVARPDPASAARLAAGAQEAIDVGVAAIEQEVAIRVDEVLALADRHGLPVRSPRQPGQRAGIVALAPEPAEVGALAAALANVGVTVTTRDGNIRISPHAGTTAASMQMLDEAFGAFVGTRL